MNYIYMEIGLYVLYGKEVKDMRETEQKNWSDRDVEALIALLDDYSQAGGSRMRLDIVEGEGEIISQKYHHGRCDVGSPWACGTAFDVIE